MREKNAKAAYDLYKFGKNANDVTDLTGSGKFSLRSMAQHEGLEDNSNDRKRLHRMYENFYGGTNFADDLVSDQLKHGTYPAQTVPDMIQTIVTPQYAIRAFFAAYDSCEFNKTIAEEYWDKGAAALVGSIEGESALGNENLNGLSWFALGKTYCHLFHCGDGDFDNPSYRRKMMDNVKFGRDYIRSGRCSAVHKKIIAMESLLITPLLHGILYHTYELSENRHDETYARVFAYGKAILPFLNVESKEDASIIEESLSNKDFEFNEEHRKKIWIAVTMSITGLGVNCADIGKDTFGVLEKDADFCDLHKEVTKFPTPAPKPTVSPQPTKAPKTPDPTAMPTPTANIRNNEFHPTFKAFFRDDRIEYVTKT